MKRVWLVFLLTVACSAASAQTGIKTVVKILETHYSVRHHGVPGLWLAKPFMNGAALGAKDCALPSPTRARESIRQ